jgi:hypothetical protein
MYGIHPLALQPRQRELSRHAAARYAILAAVKERRSLKRRSSRSPQAVRSVPHLAAIDGWSPSRE